MSSLDFAAAPAAPPKVLASASIQGQEFQVVQHANGGLAITVDGASPDVYRWGPGQVESCMTRYLSLLRRR